MAGTELAPEKITRPFQLLAAWLTGLVLVDGLFLGAATQISQPSWIAPLLTIAAVVNVPAFLLSIFLLQTRFRPEMQEDEYYSKYLERRTLPAAPPIQSLNVEERAKSLAQEILKALPPPKDVLATAEQSSPQYGSPRIRDNAAAPIEQLLIVDRIDQLASRLSENRTIAELYLRPGNWHSVVRTFSHDLGFMQDLADLKAEGLVSVLSDDVETAHLTSLGTRVAHRQQELRKAYNFNHESIWGPT